MGKYSLFTYFKKTYYFARRKVLRLICRKTIEETNGV